MIKYPQQARRLLEYTNQLIDKGYRKKDIAALLETPAPVFSSLFKTILPILAEISPEDPNPEEKIQYAFSQVNNMSSSKTLQLLEEYVAKLEVTINKNLTQNQNFDYFSLLKQEAKSSYDFIKQYYEGLYEFYYLSSDNNLVKKEPFLICANSVEKNIEVSKGNKNSRLLYRGIGLLSNHHTLTCQLSEANDNPQEHIMIHLSLPFIRKSEFLRGVFIAINYACQPLARKVVIKKAQDNWNEADIDKMETVYFNDDNSDEIKEIHSYLTSEPGKIECFSIPNPKFDLEDLEQELKIAEQIRNQYS
jgi:hypothetical protein